MGYTRTFSQLITLRYSGTVDGKSYSGSVSETVYVNVHVDTNPFDNSVVKGAHKVDELTGAVTVTKAVQLQAIKESAERIGNTIVGGFYRTVQSELTQQMAALSNQVESLTAHIMELAKRCNDKKRQMEVDYGRLTSRYSKLFAELNSELATRVGELDRPAFTTYKTLSEATQRLTVAGGGAETAVAGAESQSVSTLIKASRIKNSARRVVGLISDYLGQARMTESTLSRVSLPGGGQATRYCAVIMGESVTGESGEREVSLYRSHFMPDGVSDSAVSRSFDNVDWHQPTPETGRRVNDAFSRMVASMAASGDERRQRVAETMLTLAEKSTPLTNI